MKKLLVALTILVCLALAPSAVGGFSDGGDRPTTPGGVRIVHNGEWVYFNVVYEGAGTVKLSGNYTCAKHPTYLQCDVTYDTTAGTWIDVDVNGN